ncbi:hypothetical protein MRX96_020093 [Rhipicephalus microplus]
MTSSAISLFEVTTHDNRPLSIAVSITIGLLVADSWFFLLVPWSLRWERKLSVFLLPALVLLPTFLLGPRVATLAHCYREVQPSRGGRNCSRRQEPLPAG